MTIKQTIKAIKSLPGMTAIYTEFKEFRVRHVDHHECDYFTTDKDDALASAKIMSSWDYSK